MAQNQTQKKPTQGASLERAKGGTATTQGCTTKMASAPDDGQWELLNSSTSIERGTHNGKQNHGDTSTTVPRPCVAVGADIGNTADGDGTSQGARRSARVEAAKHTTNTTVARPHAELSRPRRCDRRARRRAGVFGKGVRPAQIEARSAASSNLGSTYLQLRSAGVRSSIGHPRYSFGSYLRNVCAGEPQVRHEKRGVLHLHMARNAAHRPVLHTLHAAILGQAQKLSNLSGATQFFYNQRVLVFGHECYYTPCLTLSQSPCVTTSRVFF